MINLAMTYMERQRELDAAVEFWCVTLFALPGMVCLIIGIAEWSRRARKR